MFHETGLNRVVIKDKHIQVEGEGEGGDGTEREQIQHWVSAGHKSIVVFCLTGILTLTYYI